MRPGTLGVVGAGTMGAGIAQLGAAAGMRTLLHDPVDEALERGSFAVRRGLAKWVEKGRADAEAAGLLEPVASARGARRRAELVIEAAPERPELKRELFAQLSEVCARRRGARHQHVVDPGHVAGRRGGAPRERGRDALLQPAAADAAARADPRGPDRRARLRDGARDRRGDGQAGDRRAPTARASSSTAAGGRSAARACGSCRSASPTTSRSTASAGSAAASGWARSS